MNEGQDLQRAASMGPQTPQPGRLGGAQAVRADKEGELLNFLTRLQKSNARFNELVLMQRDAAIRICGVNPIDEPPPTDAPEATGLTSEINSALIYLDELNGKMNGLTERWMAL